MLLDYCSTRPSGACGNVIFLNTNKYGLKLNISLHLNVFSIYLDFFTFQVLWDYKKCSDYTGQMQSHARQNKDKSICLFFPYFYKCGCLIRAIFGEAMMLSSSC